jgi:RimJ/RimL family protein N-acetyltransferase
VKTLTVRPLTAADGGALAAMLQAQSADYMAYFIPFAFDAATITGLLTAARHDCYMGFFVDDALAGFFMLRGWDAGYDVPAYGVTIAQAYSGLGLARLSLDLSKTICRLRQVKRLMLKVHPENTVAKRLYEQAGFVQTGIDPRNANLIYHFELA